MALVMLPCDLPWWCTLQRHLSQVKTSNTIAELVAVMLKIHNMCNIGLDPDDDVQDQTVFAQLEKFLETELTGEERQHFLENTAPSIVDRALELKQYKPAHGFHFSLQQQPDRVEYERSFVASLLAHAFFSTFPKRTDKTHPTLQDFNFTHFYTHLDNNCQKAKLRSVLHYFDYLDMHGDCAGEKIVFSRKVMTSKQWLTIEDWLECGLPLCNLSIKHEGRIERAAPSTMRICFSSTRLGGHVLSNGYSQESVQFCTKPELLVMLSSVEALEDNEALTIEGLYQVSRINDPKCRATYEPITEPQLVNVCCMDPDSYTGLPHRQFEEDNVLRELNKALLGFRQQSVPLPLPVARRLTPIGESFSSTHEVADTVRVTEASPERETETTKPADWPSPVTLKPADWLSPASRRGRFIVLGSSGECLPVTRTVIPAVASPAYSSCASEASSDEYLSARGSVERDENEPARKYSAELGTPERRSTFAERLRDALCRETLSLSSSTDSSYAVGISVAGSDLAENNIRLRRGGSRGFMLQEDSVDDQFLRESLQQEREWIDRFRARRAPGLASRAGESSQYSFSTEYSSELEELYEQFSRWLDDSGTPDAGGCDGRDQAVAMFAGSLLKRTLSESFAGVSLCEVPAPLADGSGKLVMAARSLSLELARHKHRLAEQLVCKRQQSLGTAGVRAVATGNWGCGTMHLGDPQLKLIIQWLAASVAGVPTLYYYTCGHQSLLKLDTVCRVLLDRQWTVGELINAAIKYSQVTLNDPSPSNNLFDDLIGSEKSGSHSNNE